VIPPFWDEGFCKNYFTSTPGGITNLSYLFVGSIINIDAIIGTGFDGSFCLLIPVAI
jgi:hypothetical protein